MNLQKPIRWKRKINSLLWRIINWLENNNNTNFETNGEKYFLEQLFPAFSKQENNCLLDVGAHEGAWAITAEKILQKQNIPHTIHLFEPMRQTFEKLKQTIPQNNSHFILNNLGASDHTQEQEIFYDRQGSTLASLHPRNLAQNTVLQTDNIQLIRLDEYIENQKINHIQLLKIDVEGHEKAVLEGLGQYLNPTFIDAIQFEYGATTRDANYSLLQLYQLLEKKQFILAKLMPQRIEKRPYELRLEHFNYANYVALSPKMILKP
ncbi:MAG: FkbM family methyltransferase [Cytophagales bacterium]|nr:MAG: FkbM family methyltransferase [Cytophagales bacterium]